MSYMLGRDDPRDYDETTKVSRLQPRYSTDIYPDAHDNGNSTPSKHDSAFSAAGAIQHDDTMSKRERVKNLGHEAKTRAKKFLRKRRISPEEVDAEENENFDNPYVDIQDNPAFQPAELISNQRITVGGTKDRALASIATAGKALLHPGHAIKRKAATKVAVQDQPYMSQNADLEYLNAHDNVARARSSCENSSGGDILGDNERLQHRLDRVQELEDLRESRKVAWITSRHIERAVVVQKRELPTPRKEDYYLVDEKTGNRHLDWQAWLYARNANAVRAFAINSMGHIDTAGEPTFHKEVFALYMERLLIASSPWQSWASSMRQIYRWEDPRKTTKWLVVWLVVWYLDYMMTFVLAYTAFIVLENKYRPNSVERLRESYDRALDQGTAAFKFNELIHKHGTDKWLDPVMETMGPKLQIQLCDTADFLETLNNFYNWKVPEKTWATLFWFATAIALGVLTPSGYSVKIVWMFCLVSFFLGRPIASMNPEYRHSVNALKWIFWDIPNDADWALMYLRRIAQNTRERLIAQRVEMKYDQDINSPAAERYFASSKAQTRTDPEQDADTESDSDAESWHTVDSSTSILGGLDIMSFRCHEAGVTGRLIIYSDGLRFERSKSMGTSSKAMWRRSWQTLVEIRKVKGSSMVKLLSAEGLHLTFTDGIEVNLDAVRRRDRAFNCIVGFSALPFQVLRPVEATHGEDKFVGDKHDIARQNAKTLMEDTI